MGPGLNYVILVWFLYSCYPGSASLTHLHGFDEVRMHPYGHPLHWKVLKYYIYIRWKCYPDILYTYNEGLSHFNVVPGHNQQYHVVSTQMWHTAEPWPLSYSVCVWGGVYSNEHPRHIKYAKHLLYVWSLPDICMKWIRGPNHNITLWLVPRCDTKPGPDHGHTGRGGILMTIHSI